MSALSFSCKKDDDGKAKADEAAERAATEREAQKAKVVNRSIPGTPLEISLPEDWRLDDVDAGKLPPPPGEGDGGPAGGPDTGAGSNTDKKAMELLSRTMLSARAPSSKRGEHVTAWLLVQHDPWLPTGTTTTDYLEAQRASNQGAVPDLQHVEAERSRRQGRPAYYVRDEWSAPFLDGGTMAFSQETLLLIDVEDERLHGYALTVTLPKDDRDELAHIIREMLESVRFKKP